MSHTWMCRVTYRMSNVTCMDASCHIWMRHVTHEQDCCQMQANLACFSVFVVVCGVNVCRESEHSSLSGLYLHHVYIYMCECVHVCVCACMCINICARVCMCVYVRACVSACLCMRVRVCEYL